MELVDAALAFALTLMALAGVTTLVVELGHRVLALKARQFERMIRDLVAAEIEPYAVRKYLLGQDQPATGLPPEIQAVVSATLGAPKAIADMSDAELRRLLPALAEARFDQAQDWVREALARLLANSSIPETARTGLFRAVEQMDTDVLLERLGKLAVFEDLKKAGGKALAETVARIEATYEDIAATARDFFTRRAKFVSLAVGVALAFAVNADGYRIFRLYLQEPATAQRIVAQQDKLARDWQAAQAALAKTLAELKTRPLGAGGDAANRDVQAIRERIQAIDTRIGALRSQGLPIGYDAMEPVPPGANLYVHWATWALSVVITGLLIGLGGPFWYDIAIKLSQARHIVRGSGSTVPVDTGKTARSSAGRLLSLLASRSAVGAAGIGAATVQGRSPHARNLAAFEGTAPVSRQA